jgi:hypothetical protein
MISIDVPKKKIKLYSVCLINLRLTAEFSETQPEKRGTQLTGANPHFS